MKELEKYKIEISGIIAHFQNEVTAVDVKSLYGKIEAFSDHYNMISNIDKMKLREFILSLHDVLCFLFTTNTKKTAPIEIYSLIDDIKKKGVDNITLKKETSIFVKNVFQSYKFSDSKDIVAFVNREIERQLSVPPQIYQFANESTIELSCAIKLFRDNYPLSKVIIERNGITSNLFPPQTLLNNNYFNKFLKYCHITPKPSITGDLKELNIYWTGNKADFEEYWNVNFKMDKNDIRYLLQQCFIEFEGVKKLRNDFEPQMNKTEIQRFIKNLYEKYKPSDNREQFAKMLKNYFPIYKTANLKTIKSNFKS